MEIESAWRVAAEEIAHREGAERIYVVGAPDSGKSSFCDYLLATLRPYVPVSYLDCDCGQARLGPPATIGLSLPDQIVLRFVGNSSPPGHLLQLISGVKRLAQESSRFTSRCVIDSSGFVSGPGAREFQISLIELLAPACVVAIGGGAALNSIVRNAQVLEGITVKRLSAPMAVRRKTAEARRAYRQRRFSEYFASAAAHEIPLGRIPLHGNLPNFNRRDSYVHRLCALCDAGRYVLAVATVSDVDLDRRVLRVAAPPYDSAKVASLQFGSIFVDSHGREQ